MKEKHCNKCKLIRPLTQFNKKRASADGFQPYCKDCCAAMSAKSYRRRKKILARAGKKTTKPKVSTSTTQTPKHLEKALVFIVPMSEAKEIQTWCDHAMRKWLLANLS